MPYASEKRQAITAIFIVFLFIFSEIIVTENNYQEELDFPVSSHSSFSYSVNTELHISSQFPNSNFATSPNNLIGIDTQGHEYRSLYRFSNNLSASNDLILDAKLELNCEVISQTSPSQAPRIYAATVIANFGSSDVTWNEITDSIPWQVAGIEGDMDRYDWDVPSENTLVNLNTYSYEVNVTKQVQSSLDLGRNKFDFVLSAIGGELSCAKSNNATISYHPELIISSSQGSHDNGGYVEQTFASSGSALMTDDFIMSADTNPRIKFDNLNGSDVQFQFSLSDDFRNDSDLQWIYSTEINQFILTGTSGYYDIPLSESFPLSSVIYFRVRSIDNTSKISEWSTGHFFLPDYNVVNNNDGTATISLNQSEFNLMGHNLFGDTYIDSLAIQGHGQDEYMYVSNDVNHNKVSLIKLNLNLLGIHTNATVNSALLDLERISVTSSGPTLSLHPIVHNLWSEDEATWNYGRIGQPWSNGGLDDIGASEVTNVDSNAVSDLFNFDIQNSIQEHLDVSDNSPLSFSLTGTVPGDSSPSFLEEIKFASANYIGGLGSGPRLNITYSWTNNQTSPGVEIIKPLDMEPVWDIVNDNITGDTTPSLEWQSSTGDIMEYMMQLSTDELFRDISFDYDSQNNVPASGLISENYTFSTSNQLNKGQSYHWRVKLIDSDGRVGAWQYASFFISTLESEWLGGDVFRFVINNSLDPNLESVPGFRYSSISGSSPNTNSYGYPYLYVANSYNALLGIGLQNYQLPDSYAVISSNLNISVSSSSGSPFDVGIWELADNNWSEQEVTWLESSNGVPWNSPGASSSVDRVGLLTNFSVASNCCSQINVTSAVQNSMRDGNSVSFLFELMPDASSSSNVLFNSPLNQNLQLQPELEIIFTLGSNQKPIPPSALSPSNGEWIYKNNSTLESASIENLTWAHNNPMPVIGWALEIDSTDTFNSIDKRTMVSWNDIGFDVNQCVYELQTPLDVGERWYWRVRGLSNSYQLGDWSQVYTFYQPDFNYNMISSNSFSTEYHHGSAFSNEVLPNFIDTAITDSNSASSNSAIYDNVLDVGMLADGTNSSILISIPMTSDMVPDNATVMSATLSLEHYSIFGSSIRLGVRKVIVPWDDSASNLQFNSTNTWNRLGGRGIGTDISRPYDIIMSQSGTNDWDITEIAQSAIAQGESSLSLMIYSDSDQIGDVAKFYSSENSQLKPKINLTWVEGQRTIGAETAEAITPIDGQIYFNQTSHAVLPETRPEFSWALPSTSSINADAWRIFVQLDNDNDMEGELIFDSRLEPHLFDLNTSSFVPDQDIDFNTEITWMVQPIESGVYGKRSNSSTYLIPIQMGQELSSISASLTIQDGSMYPQLNYPSSTTDIYLDEGTPYQSDDSTGLRIGNSSTLNVNRSASTSIISFNFSNLNLPSVYEITNAELKLTALSGSGDVDISASRMLTEWDENSTWENATVGQQWLSSGALRGADSELPDSMIFVDTVGEHVWNVTRIVQMTIASNQDTANILLQPEIINSVGGAVNGNYLFADSEHPIINLRPKLVIEYQTTQPWLPPSISQINPSNNSILWNQSSAMLSGAEYVNFEISQPISNHTSITLCHGNEIRWLSCINNTAINQDYTWDPNQNIFNYSDINSIISDTSDQWQYWRVRVDQGHRLGTYSPLFQYRVPTTQSAFDGIENYTLELSRGSVFETTGDVPNVSDSSTDSNINQNLGDSPFLGIGTDQATGGVFETYFEYDFSDLYFIPTATPISMELELDLDVNSIGQSPMSIALFVCDSFDENTITNTNKPSCATSELSRTTLDSSSSGIIEWDLLNLGQNNFFTSNYSMSFKLTAVAGQSNFVQFHSSETLTGVKPNLRLIYINNFNLNTPPNQPTLISPTDGTILYNSSTMPVSSSDSVELQWVTLPSATSYKLYVKSESGVSIFDSLFDPGFLGSSYNTTILEKGESYEWWVQGYNQSIPGPSSNRWMFSLGDPDHNDNNDGTLSYNFSDSSEIIDIGHPNVRDMWITDAFPGTNYGNSQTLEIGGGCQNTAGSVCAAIISVDSSQLPLDSNTQNIHSINLEFQVDGWDLTGGAYQVEFSVHELLFSGWDEMSLTWNNTGTNPGLQPGVDYVSQPIDVKSYTTTDQILSFEVAQDVDSIGDVMTYLIRGTPISTGGNFDGFVSVFSSEAIQSKRQPAWSLTHTNVASMNISTQTNIFDADGTYTFNIDGYDSNGQIIASDFQAGAEIEWETTSGSITSIGTTIASLSPTTSGIHTITGCFGVICTDYIMQIDPGMPVEIQASFSQTSDLDYIEMSADDDLEVYSYAIDQHGNLVTSEVISFTSSNGTIDSNGLFTPYSAGLHTITAEWVSGPNSLQEILEVNVLPGTPVLIEISGCADIIQADTQCDLFGSAFDQFNNVVWFDEVGSLTVNLPSGEFSPAVIQTPHSLPPATQVAIGTYTGDLIGQWEINFISEFNLMASTFVNVTHGAISAFELSSSNSTVTADDVLYLNTTRIDVRGNRLDVLLPAENWTSYADGDITLGNPAIWSPKLQGTKTITATYEGYTDTITVFVLRGIIHELEIIIDDEISNDQTFSITTDQEVSASIKGKDVKGNQWIINGNWSFFHPEFSDLAILSDTYSQQISFSPTMASSIPYTIHVEHTELSTVISEKFTVYVSVGDINYFEVIAVDSNGFNFDDSELNQITSDDFVQFSYTTEDSNGNNIQNSQPTWLLEQIATGQVTDISDIMLQNGFVWQASLVGDWKISVYLINDRGFNLSTEYDISVMFGMPIDLIVQQSATTQDAGGFIDLLVTGIDADGNEFPQPVAWLENNGPSFNINGTTEDAFYRFNGRSAGNYTISAEYLGLSKSVYVDVFPLGVVKNIKSNISTTQLEQLDSIIVEISAYDQYWNVIAVPNSARIDTTDRGDVKYLGGGVWELSTLDKGEHSATIVIGSITETFTYNVEGNLAGFFAAGGPLYYAGAGLVGLIVIALLVFVIRLLRGDEDYYDEDDDDDFYQDSSETPTNKDFSQPRISQAPTVPTPPAQPPTPEPEPAVEESTEIGEEDTSWMADYRVDEDGTEWGQTEDGVWYYRDTGSDDWTEWTD